MMPFVIVISTYVFNFLIQVPERIFDFKEKVLEKVEGERCSES